MGFRFLLYPKKLPGKPDLALPKWKAAIFVNGCFWHGHNCDLFKWPKTRPDFWKKKITGNRERDTENILALEDIGWRVLTIWECAIKGKNRESLDGVLLRSGSWIRGRGEKLEIDSTGARKNGKA
jgi:DNA mismatch endonuclease (patch repair protein)